MSILVLEEKKNKILGEPKIIKTNNLRNWFSLIIKNEMPYLLYKLRPK
jgi:hypothetical protein